MCYLWNLTFKFSVIILRSIGLAHLSQKKAMELFWVSIHMVTKLERENKCWRQMLNFSPCINYMQYQWGCEVPMRICITCESYHQYLWVISSVPMRICSTHESYPQYPWGYAVLVSHILSTREDIQYRWVISSVPVSHILSTREDMQYPWVNLYEWRINETSLTGAAYPHGYWWYDSRVLMIWLMGNAYPHGYCI